MVKEFYYFLRQASVYVGESTPPEEKMFWALQIININISTWEHDERAFWLLKKTKNGCFSEEERGEEERYNVL